MDATTSLSNLTEFHDAIVTDQTTEIATTTRPEDPLIQMSIDYRVGVTCILVPVGTVGNIMTIVILRRKSFAKNTHSFFLTCLAVIDICILYTCLLPDTVTKARRSPHFNWSDFMCKFNWYIMIVLTNMSSWLLVTLSLERVVSVWLPFRAKQLCSKKIGAIVFVSTSITLVVFNIVLVMNRFWLDRMGNCHADDGLWAWINSAVYSFMPGSIMAVCSAAVIIKLWVMPAPSGSKSRKISSNVLMMLALNFSFLATTSPTVIVFAATDISKKLGEGDGVAFIEVSVVQMLFFSNSAINFMLYVMSGPAFRKEVLGMLGRKRKVEPSGGSRGRSDQTADQSTM